MIVLKSAEEIELMREAALVVSRTLGLMAEMIKPGVTPMQLDAAAEAYILEQDALPGFKGKYDYPYTIMTSVNEQVVHGMPNDRPLEEGDIVSVDCGSIKHGYYGDHAYTFAVGKISEDKQRLIDVTKECLYKGIAKMRSGKRTGDVGYAVQQHAESNGYGVVRELVGHGIGKELHEKPELPNYGRKNRGDLLKSGMTLAIEPMINMGTKDVVQLNDGWTIVTKDGKPSAHFEHDVAIVDGQPEILSSFHFVEDILGIPHSH